MAISGFYVGLYVVFKGLSAVFSSPKKAEVGEGAPRERGAQQPVGTEEGRGVLAFGALLRHVSLAKINFPVFTYQSRVSE